MSDSMTRTLRMKYLSDGGKTVTVSVANCKSDLDAGTVRAAMGELKDRAFFSFDVEAAAGADIVERKVTELF